MQADVDHGAHAADAEIHASAGAGRGAGEGERRQADGSGGPAGLPLGVGRIGPMLQCAAATGAEMGAGRDDAVGGGGEDDSIGGEPVTALGQEARLDRFAGQRVGEVERPLAGGGDAVSVRADLVDANGAGRLSRRRRRGPSVPGQGSTHARRACPRRC